MNDTTVSFRELPIGHSFLYPVPPEGNHSWGPGERPYDLYEKWDAATALQIDSKQVLAEVMRTHGPVDEHICFEGDEIVQPVITD